MQSDPEPAVEVIEQEVPQTESPVEAVPRGPDVIAAFVKTLPNKPGVYRMFNEAGDVLYVGKARNLKKRVVNYARLVGHDTRIARMILATCSMEFVTTNSEAEALLLEANLIKKLKPRYNVLLRDDKSFPYILITKDHQIAQIKKHRGARNQKGDYFGPFASAGAVNRTINALQRAFLLRSCTDSVYENRSRPCLLYQIKRCAAPCTGEVSNEEYADMVDEVLQFLAGKSQKVKDTLAKAMEDAAEVLDFETAARYRDRISALSHVQATQGINPQTVGEADVFGIADEGGQTCIQVFFFRGGQNWGNRAYYPRADKGHARPEILEAFLAQFYDDKLVPKQILLSDDIAGRVLLEDALGVKTGSRVRVNVPQRGEKLALVSHAVTNAHEALGRRMAESSSQTRLLEGVQKIFKLEEMPKRIEIYDNSHIQGAHAVGGMVVAGPEGFLKNQYRKFNIKSTDIAAGDDFAMMREVLMRRFSRLLKEQGEHPAKDEDDGEASPWPDLVFIDGGRGQLSATQAVMDELGIKDVVLAGIAKGPDRNAGREHFHLTGQAPFMLEPRDPVLYYIQRLRDEAHRFAIGTHRARRKKAIGANPLDEISGIGPGRKKALLRHFGSARAVSRANAADLSSVEGISKALAKQIYEHFHEGAE